MDRIEAILEIKTRNLNFQYSGSAVRIILKIYEEDFISFYDAAGKAIEQVSQRSCRCPIPGGSQCWVGWALGSLLCWKVALPQQEIGLEHLVRLHPTWAILQFCGVDGAVMNQCLLGRFRSSLYYLNLITYEQLNECLVITLWSISAAL